MVRTSVVGTMVIEDSDDERTLPTEREQRPQSLILRDVQCVETRAHPQHKAIKRFVAQRLVDLCAYLGLVEMMRDCRTPLPDALMAKKKDDGFAGRCKLFHNSRTAHLNPAVYGPVRDMQQFDRLNNIVAKLTVITFLYSMQFIGRIFGK